MNETVVAEVGIVISEVKKKELSDHEHILEKTLNRLNLCKEKMSITENEHFRMCDDLELTLDELGKLTEREIGHIRIAMKNIFDLLFPYNPQKAYLYYWNSFKPHAKPYDRLKNKAHDIMDEVDKFYKKIHGRLPIHYEND
jgi:hypothetical protein